jgi:hypothetical protein
MWTRRRPKTRFEGGELDWTTGGRRCSCGVVKVGLGDRDDLILLHKKRKRGVQHQLWSASPYPESGIISRTTLSSRLEYHHVQSCIYVYEKRICIYHRDGVWLRGARRSCPAYPGLHAATPDGSHLISAHLPLYSIACSTISPPLLLLAALRLALTYKRAM